MMMRIDACLRLRVRPILAVAVVAGLASAAAGCSSATTPAASTAIPTWASSTATTLTVSGAVSLTLQVSDVSCNRQEDGSAGWEIDGQGYSFSAGQIEPWSLIEYPSTNPAELRLALPDGFQYDSDAEATSEPAGLTVSTSAIALVAVPLYTNGDTNDDEITVTGTVPCSKQ
jgi:hypothetical protein